MIFINELAGYLVIKWKNKGPEFAESLFNKFPNISIPILIFGLYEGCEDVFWDSYYYQTSDAKQLLKQSESKFL